MAHCTHATGSPITCPSAEPHEPPDYEIRDHVLHYFDCIEICDRRKFFDNDSPLWKQEKQSIIKELRDHPDFGNRDEKSIEEEADIRAADKRGSVAIAIEAQYVRTDTLLKAMIADDQRTNLVRFVKESRGEWTSSDEYKRGIVKVGTWRTNHGKLATTASPPKPQDDITEEDIPEERVTVRAIKERQELKSTWNSAWDEKTAKYSVLRDVNAYVIQYDLETSSECNPVSEDSDDLRFKGKFPDQRLALTYLLKSDPESGWDSILSMDRHPSRLRYFHIPSNNMAWVEKVMAKYFNEEDLQSDPSGGPKRGNHSRRAHMLLRSEYWRGQQHGGGKTLVHTRHMKPLCERVSSDKSEAQKTPNNLVLFMPYLHWETDCSREHMSKVLETQVESHRKSIQSRLREETVTRKARYADLDREVWPRPKHSSVKKLDKVKEPTFPLRSFSVLADMLPSRHKESLRKTKIITFEYVGSFRRMITKNKLGQFLYDSTKLYQGLLMLRDEKLTEEYLYHDAPLHPRRTLDQYYYGTMSSTKQRDRDQVVYRGTALDVQRAHRFTEAQDVHRRGLLSRFAPKAKSFLANEESDANDTSAKAETRIWSEHTLDEDEHGCDHCRANICKVSRVVMVDQLWMWILDERTIITFFPKMYGVNKRNNSGVHKCIRDRLRTADKDHIRSVFDLALVILDECSNTFFDRTKTQERQPQMIDIFAEAIGTVNYRATRAFRHLWRWTETAGSLYRSKKRHVEAMNRPVHLLDIHREGQLQKEIKDIIEELDMMLHVNRKQKEVIKRFSRNVEHILDPPGNWRTNDSSGAAWYDGRTPPVPVVSTSQGSMASRPTSSVVDDNEQKKFDWFRQQAFGLLSDVADRIDELEDLRKEAEGTANTVQDLLELKQQQAGVVQAWQAVKQADETVSQGRAIMMFTIMTIVFLPLSFISSVFGMNNGNFDSGWTFREQALHYMLPISAGIIFITLLLAFSTFCRATLWWLWLNISTVLVVKTQAYRFWLSVRGGPQYKILRKVEKSIGKMKEEVRKAKYREKAKKSPTAENDTTAQGDGDTGTNKWREQVRDLLVRKHKKPKPSAGDKNSGAAAEAASMMKADSVTHQEPGDGGTGNGHGRPAQPSLSRAHTMPVQRKPGGLQRPGFVSPPLPTSMSAPLDRTGENGRSNYSTSIVSTEEKEEAVSST